MLTGNADQETAVHAVNEGQIFRFINKPCAKEDLIEVLESALQHYRLMRAEQELLENTFKGAVQILSDIMELTNPVLFSRSQRIKYFVKQVVDKLALEQPWKYEVAAMLSQIGCVAIPADVMEKINQTQSLSEEEEKMCHMFPKVGGDLLASLPRLEDVSRMIEGQKDDFHTKEASENKDECTAAALGADMLHAVIDFDACIAKNENKVEAFKTIQASAGRKYNPVVVKVMESLELPQYEKKYERIPVAKIQVEMVLAEEVKTEAGLLLVPKDHTVTSAVKTLLLSHASWGTIKKNILVSIPIQKKGEQNDEKAKNIAR